MTSERRPLDFYPTPLPLAFAVCEWLDKEGMGPKPADRILEPSCGSGNFVQAAARQWPEAFIRAVDVNPTVEDLAKTSGANEFLPLDIMTLGSNLKYQLILGNPPYNQAEVHVRKALTLLDTQGVLAFVLRLNFLGSNKRLQLWKDHPPLCIAPIVPRPDFTGDGGDSTEYGLFVWAGAAFTRGRFPYWGQHITWEKQRKCRTKKLQSGAAWVTQPNADLDLELMLAA